MHTHIHTHTHTHKQNKQNKKIRRTPAYCGSVCRRHHWRKCVCFDSDIEGNVLSLAWQPFSATAVTVFTSHYVMQTVTKFPCSTVYRSIAQNARPVISKQIRAIRPLLFATSWCKEAPGKVEYVRLGHMAHSTHWIGISVPNSDKIACICLCAASINSTNLSEVLRHHRPTDCATVRALRPRGRKAGQEAINISLAKSEVKAGDHDSVSDSGPATASARFRTWN